MISNEKNKLSRDAKEYRNKLIGAVSERLSEDAALILEFIRKATGKDSYSYSSDEMPATTMEEIAERTSLNETRIRWELHTLVAIGFVIKDTKRQANRYSISEDGVDAAGFLLDEYTYPGRKIKIKAILEAKKKGN